jgi:hypothetical protein
MTREDWPAIAAEYARMLERYAQRRRDEEATARARGHVLRATDLQPTADRWALLAIDARRSAREEARLG